jgi:hypothetical protein
VNAAWAATPRAIVDKLNHEMMRILNSKALKDRLTNEGA